jgi:hypothetical protein
MSIATTTKDDFFKREINIFFEKLINQIVKIAEAGSKNKYHLKIRTYK